MEDLKGRAKLAVVLGSGLGAFERSVCIDSEVPYREIAGLRDPSVEGHSGRLILGRLGEGRVILFSGRPHRYEGLTAEEAGSPARIAAELGCRRLLLTQAAGGLRRDLPVGGWMLATDVVSLPGPPEAVLREKGRVGSRGKLISERFRSDIEDVALRSGIRLAAGVLCWTIGPCYETRAESLALVELGASAASMSGLPELIAARTAGVDAAILSFITNHAPSVTGAVVDHGSVLEAGESGIRDLECIIAGLLRRGGP